MGFCPGESREDEIERLQQIIKQLQSTQYGRRSEQLDPDQFALALEDLDADIARIREPRPVVTKAETSTRRRTPLLDDLEREDVLIDVDGAACAGCGGALHPIGESVSEMLDWAPATLRVRRIRRPKYACRSCETIVQAPAPGRVIAGGLATPALLADRNRPPQPRRAARLSVRRAAKDDRRAPHQPPRQTAAVGLETAESCQVLTNVQQPDAYSLTAEIIFPKARTAAPEKWQCQKSGKSVETRP